MNLIYVGAKHSGDRFYCLTQIFVPECFALRYPQAGRSIRIEKFWLNYRLCRSNASPLQTNFMVRYDPSLIRQQHLINRGYTTEVRLRGLLKPAQAGFVFVAATSVAKLT